MKVIHCINYFLPQQIAGTEMYVYALIKALGNIDFESLIIIPNYGCKENEEYYYEQIRVIKYAEPSDIDRDLQMGKRKPDGLGSFIELLKTEGCDVVHFHEIAGSNGITHHHFKAAKDLGLKVVMTFHLATNSCKTGTLMYKNSIPCDGLINIQKCSICSYHQNGVSDPKASILYSLAEVLYKLNINASKWGSKLGTALAYPFIIEKLQKNLKLLESYCDKMVVISQWYLEVLLKNGISKNRIQLIKQGTFYSSNIEFVRTNTVLPIKLIFVGRISHFKGVKILLTALQRFDPGKVCIDIYGDSGESEYMAECKQMSINMTNVTWKGRLAHKEVLKTMGEYDILCLPSTFSEMSPLVIQEAFGAGIPVFASEAYGNAEQIRHEENGWLFKFSDVQALSSELQKLIEDPSKIDMAKRNIPKVNSFESVAKEYELLYGSLLNCNVH